MLTNSDLWFGPFGEMVANIRQSTQRGLALGSGRFKDKIEALGNRRQRFLLEALLQSSRLGVAFSPTPNFA